MSYREAYESWLSNPYFDEDTKEELRSIAMMRKRLKIVFIWILNLVQPV